MINVAQVSVTFMGGTPFAKKALKEVSFVVEEPSFVAIAGRSGCGKSTLLKLIGGLLAADCGSIEVEGCLMGGKQRSAAETAALVAMAFQNPEHQFFAETVKEELSFGARNIGKSQGEIDRAIGGMLPLIGLDDSYLLRSPFQLSGGEQRRVALASIFLMDTPVILLDEPTAGLDPVGKRRICALVKTMQSKGKTVLWVGHDLPEMVSLAQRLLVMAEGRLIFDGAPEKIGADDALREQAGLLTFTDGFDLDTVLRENYGIFPDSDTYFKLKGFFTGEED
ncbi:MAG TPA: ATP-binding cassette domain-containing protein [Clostridiales bacterium]|nr:ATP-binding cassette domain-containing protein [Clostridiales bacterium]